MTANKLNLYERIYNNNGQQVEVDLSYTLTGKPQKVSNEKGGADVLTYQVKSFRATVCHGHDLNNILTEYKDAEAFAFCDRNEATWYEMTKAEFIEFVRLFAEYTYDSKKNGGRCKVRLNRRIKEQKAYLRAKAIS